MERSALPNDKKIILFDGVCNLCDSVVHFIIKRDRKDLFRFVSLQSDLGQNILSHIGVDQHKIDSFILYEPGTAYYYKAEAVIRVAYSLGGMYRCLSLFAILPKRITNFCYDYVARNRYKWYGKKDSCWVPTPDISAKFLE